MKSTKENVKAFWDEQAKTWQTSPLATAPDTYYRELEIKSIQAYLPEKKKVSVLDVGCGNGYSTFAFAKQAIGLRIIGLDYSADMIKQADTLLSKEKSLHKRMSFVVGDVLTLTKTPELKGQKFDYIVSERCVINLRTWAEQQQSLLEMKQLLKPGGKIIFCENTQEGLARLNALRATFDLPAIAVRWHNYYLPEKKLLAFAKKQFRVRDVVNIGSAYYRISRVVYAKLCAMEGKEPDYLHPLNQIAAQLPFAGNESPNFIFIFEKR